MLLNNSATPQLVILTVSQNLKQIVISFKFHLNKTIFIKNNQKNKSIAYFAHKSIFDFNFRYISVRKISVYHQTLDSGTLTDKIGNIHCLWLSFVTVKAMGRD